MKITKEHNQFYFEFRYYRDDWSGVYEDPYDVEYEYLSRDELIEVRDRINDLLAE